MAKESILVVEDVEEIQELLRYNLIREGFRVTVVGTGEEALEQARSLHPNLILLDLMLPRIDGLEVCRILKSDQETKDIPIVMATAKGEEADIVAGLELGADDYITKPFSPRVLVARTKAVLRRQSVGVVDESSVIRRHNLTIHPGRHEVLVNDEHVDLTYTEFKILHLLARRPGWVFTRYQIVDKVRGNEHLVSDRSVDVQIVGLRKKMGDAGGFIETVRGVGYRFKE